MNRLYETFAQSAATFAERPCLVVRGEVVTYARLAEAASRVASALDRDGLRGSAIGLYGDKSAAIYAGMLGALASENAYVPLGRREPPKRLASHARRAGLSAIVGEPRAIDTMRAVVELESARMIEDGALAVLDLRGLHPPCSGAADLAYVMFTSGSTGTPKVVPIRHASVLAFVEAMRASLPLGPDDRVLQVADLSFDFSVGEMFPTWDAGACAVVASQEERLAVAQHCEAEGVTVWSSVPTLAAAMIAMRAVKPGALARVRRAMFCGEALPLAVAETWRAVAPNAEIVNLYGPTEATVFATAYRYRGGLSSDFAVVPIGSPLPGVACAVDREGHGDRGEFLLAGPQVAEGYLGDADSTAFERRANGTTWYRTGDIVAESDEHGFLFIGRADQQVKISGHRVDLLEIENYLRTIHVAGQVAVVPVREKDGRVTGVAAFLEGTHSTPDVRRACSETLPPYMVPRRFIAIAELPRSASGKIDRAGLSAML